MALYTGAQNSSNKFIGNLSSDPSSGNAEGDLYYNTTTDLYRFYDGSAWKNVSEPPLGTQNNPASGPQALYNDGQRTNGLYYLNPDGGGAAQFYCWLDGTTTFASSISGSYGWALAMRINHPFFHGQYLANRWNGHPGSAGPNITETSTYSGGSNGAGHYLPDAATHVLFGFTNANNNQLTDWTHTSTPGDSTNNTGLYRTAMSGVSDSISATHVQSNVSGGGNYDDWHFRETNSSYYKPCGVSNGLGHNNNVDGTSSLLGVMNDSCQQNTHNGFTPPSQHSETYVGNRKNLNSGNGAGGAYCVNESSNAQYGKWMMWWR